MINITSIIKKENIFEGFDESERYKKYVQYSYGIKQKIPNFYL